MTNITTRRALFALAGSVAAGLSINALAQPATGPGNGPANGPGNGYGPGMMRGGGGPGMMGRTWNTGSYLDSLKSELAITEAQEPAWKEYAGTVSGVTEQMRGLHQTMFQSMQTAKTWEERRDLMNEMFQARQQARETVHEAATKLLPELDPTQRDKANNILPGLGYGRGMMGGPGGRGMMRGGPGAR